MFAIFMYAANAILPIILMLFTGFLLRKIGFMSKEYLAMANKVNFRFLIPVMLVYNIYNIKGLGAIQWDIVLLTVVLLLLFCFVGCLIAKFTISDWRKRAVVAITVFCANFGIIGIALVNGLCGPEGAALASMIFGFTLPITAVLPVLLFTLFDKSNVGSHSIKGIILDLVKNPLMEGAVIGLSCLFIRQFIPTDETGQLVFSISGSLPFLYSTIGTIAGAAAPMSLVVLGGMLDFSSFKGNSKEVIMITLWRVLFTPALGLLIVFLLSKSGIVPCGPAEYACFIALLGGPMSFTTAILAGEMGADDNFARQLIVTTHLTPSFTIFAFVVLFRYFGLL